MRPQAAQGMRPQAAQSERPSTRPAAGAIIFNGAVYDRQLRRCQVRAIADGQGGVEWRVSKHPFDFDGDESSVVERCFATYAEAVRWLA